MPDERDMQVLRIPQDLGEASEHQVYRCDDGTVVSYLNQQGLSRQRVLMCAPTLVYVRSGIKRLDRQGKAQEVMPGQLVLLGQGVHLMTETVESSAPYASTLLCLEEGLLRDLAVRYPDTWKEAPATRPGHHVMTPSSYVAELLEGLPRLLAHNPEPRLLSLKVEETMLAMSTSEAHEFWASAIRGALVEGDARLRAVVEGHCLTPITTAELATLAGRSLSSFKRDFTRLYKCSPGRWLLKRRLEHARDLLASGACNVTEACWRSGFAELSSFIRACLPSA
ncbi:MAG: AraC family transcriptional regulator [Myxococcota bacterium]